MSDIHTPDQRHRNMAAIHSASTKPELRLRHSLWHHGFRYLVNDKRLPGSPDIILPKYRTAIFVHGCFWHGHQGCRHYTIPKTNTDFWRAKVARNQERDQKVWRQLETKGWFVIIVWECQLKKAKLQETIEAVAAEIRQNGEKYLQERENRRVFCETYRQERKARKEKEAALMAEIKCR
ncbi:MAG: very short patch repair endonuclease [Bacteroidales bacterium]|nr:very short patch repair endonuclease [Bacteroidales bacterium]